MTALAPRLFWPLWIAAMVGAFAGLLAGVGWLKASDAPRWISVGAMLAFMAVVMPLAFAAERRCYSVRGRLSDARRRYLTRLMPAMGVYVVALGISVLAFKSKAPSGIIAYALALAPALPLIFAIGAMWRYVQEEEDEFQRTVQSQSFMLATAFALGIATVWGFLDQFGLVAHAQMWAVFPILAVCQAPAEMITRRRYR